MPAGFDVAVTSLGPLIDRLARFPTATRDALGKGLKAGTMLLLRHVLKTIYTGHAKDHLDGHTNRLRGGITFRVDVTALEAEVGTNVVYGPIHEFGGTIVPQGHPFLAIPVGDMKGSPRDHGDLFFLPTGNNAVLLDRSGKLQYALRRSVYIPPRPYFGPTMIDRGQDAANAMAAPVFKLLDEPLPGGP